MLNDHGPFSRRTGHYDKLTLFLPTKHDFSIYSQTVIDIKVDNYMNN